MRHCAAFLLLALAAARPAGAQTVPVAKIDEFVRAEMARQKIPGVAIAVVKNAAVVKIDGYGYANVEHKVPVTPATIFQSGSLGKQFTATAVMLQVEDGKLALTDSVTKYFPDAPKWWKAVTVTSARPTTRLAMTAESTCRVRGESLAASMAATTKSRV